ncbi:MAG: hypothetical protein AAFQ11_03820 [Pseudomonadota bacterium]
MTIALRHFTLLCLAITISISALAQPARAKAAQPETSDTYQVALKLMKFGYYDAVLAMMTAQGKSQASAAAIGDFAESLALGAMTKATMKKLSVTSGANPKRETLVFVEVERRDMDPTTIKFVLQLANNRWFIQGIFPENVPVRRTGPIPDLPSNDEIASLMNRSVFNFFRSARQKDMTRFRNSVSSPMRKEVSVERFNEAFKALFPLHREIARYAGVKFQFDETPKVNPTTGWLSVRGHYPAARRIDVNTRYVQEDDQWKLVFFELKVAAAN